MKHIFTAILATISVASMAQRVDTHIDNVIVYRTGATVTRTGTIDIKKGTHTYKFESLSRDLTPNSVRMVVKNDKPTIVSFNCQREKEVSDERSATIKKLQKEQTTLRKTLSELEIRKQILEHERSLIFENDQVGTEKGVDVNALSQMVKYYKSQLTTINAQLTDNNKRQRESKDRLNKVAQIIDIERLSLKNDFSVVNLTLESPEDIQEVEVELSYLVCNASWNPAYDVRIKDITKPFALDYMARIKQNTFEDWENVHLTLSTADPFEDNTKPEFSKITFPSGMHKSKSVVTGYIIGNTVTGKVISADDNQPLPGVSVFEENSNNTAITDIDGNFKLRMNNTNNNLCFSFIGYKTERLTPGGKMTVVLEPAYSELEEVVVVGYGKISGEYDTERNQAPIITSLPISIEQSIVTNQEYAIKMPYTIPCDNKDHSVNMFTYKIESDYHYSCIPRQSKDVYLMATVPNCSKYSLLPAEASLFVDNAYQGHTMVEPDNVSDTLSISAGCDKAIAVTREEVRTNKAKSFIGSTVRVSKCFEIVIKNNKNVATEVEVIDQYPISRSSDIKVTLTESAGAAVDKEKGKLTWKVSLKPHEQRKIRFSYEVVHPRSSKITVY